MMFVHPPSGYIPPETSRKRDPSHKWAPPSYSAEGGMVS